MLSLRPLLIAAGLLLSSNTFAREINVPVPLDYRLIRNVLVQQLFTGPEQTARVWKDGKECSFLDLSNPQISGVNGQVKIDNNVRAQFGAKMGGKCMTLVKWSGILETLQKPVLDKTGNVLSFPVTSTNAFDGNGQKLNIDQLQELLQQVVAPRLAGLKIDLNESRDDIVKILLPYVAAEDSEQLHDSVASLRFNSAKADAQSIVVNLGFVANIKPANNAPVAALNADELQQWQTVWQKWQSSLDKSIDQIPLPDDLTGNRDTLHEVLQKAGRAFEQGLSGEQPDGNDPVRVFINESWDKLAPLLRAVSKQLPGAEGLRYLTLIAATDLMYELESIGSPFGLEISANGLRKIARSYINHKTGQS
ncbi:hypothetical protein NP590_11235 [Methylomonas sp. SURF-2]|uniref:Uncharacterized protein n=1 Tax=Methylomonas subterranea TaxID=2952225 RepID=A0ABT1TGU3_9GAMM|nr:hypothetical protein [Methylomonas sp. SURF-2]MCQ8104680.1 hypothetical protein [Methylomonas sp. SURF-2]